MGISESFADIAMALKLETKESWISDSLQAYDTCFDLYFHANRVSRLFKNHLKEFQDKKIMLFRFPDTPCRKSCSFIE